MKDEKREEAEILAEDTTHPVIPTEEPSSEPRRGQRQTCKNCGFSMLQGMVYCQNCGKPAAQGNLTREDFETSNVITEKTLDGTRQVHYISPQSYVDLIGRTPLLHDVANVDHGNRNSDRLTEGNLRDRAKLFLRRAKSEGYPTIERLALGRPTRRHLYVHLIFFTFYLSPFICHRLDEPVLLQPAATLFAPLVISLIWQLL